MITSQLQVKHMPRTGRPVTKPPLVCMNCGDSFPGSCVIDGVRHTLYSRHYCLKCRPFGTRKHEQNQRLRGDNPPRVILDGATIGDWTVLREATREISKPRSYLCRCKCGFERTFPVSYLGTGTLTCCESCQDKALSQKGEAFIREMLGKKRGDFTIVRYEGKDEGGSRLWVCRCKCGTEVVYRTGQVLSRGSQRVRCMHCHRDDMEMSNRVTDHIPNRFWKRLCDSAKRRDIVVSISQEEAYTCYVAQDRVCALSGEPLYFTTLRSRFNRYTNASLDRIDPNKGYVSGNVQWVHKALNLMKGSFSQDDFVMWCRSVSAHLPGKST